MDDKNNIIFGNIVINDIELLKFSRDLLMNKIKTYVLFGFETLNSLISLDYYFDNNYNCLAKNEVDGYSYVDKDNSIVGYHKNLYYNNFINTISILNSLIGELNIDDYDNEVVKDFIKYGIYSVDSFDEVWDHCISNMVFDEHEARERGKYSLDYMAFRALFDDGIISYVYNDDDVISCKKNNSVLKGINQNDINRIVCSSEILGISEKKHNVIRRRK